MKKYVFSYINFFDHMLTSKVIESDKDILQIAKEEFAGIGYIVYDDIYTMDLLKSRAFDCDSMFEIIEV